MVQNGGMDEAFIQARIDSVTARITVYEALDLSLAGKPASYTVNTSQTQQTVTMMNQFQVREQLKLLYSQYAYWSNQLSSGGLVVRPFS
jgi:hypothetical protein